MVQKTATATTNGASTKVTWAHLKTTNSKEKANYKQNNISIKDSFVAAKNKDLDSTPINIISSFM